MQEGINEADACIAESDHRLQNALPPGRQLGSHESGFENPPVQSKLAKGVPTERLIFTRRKGKSLVEGNFTKVALLKSFEIFTKTLIQIRTVVAKANGSVSNGELKKTFGGTELAEAADDADWQQWIDIFRAKPPATAKGAALVFLEEKTPLKRGTIVKYCSNARNSQEVASVHKR